MISLDTETTGLDVRHGARPYCVTTCTDDGEVRWWEWDVDPLTREVIVPEDDARDVRQLLARQHGGIVGHNIKFDAAALLRGDVLDWEPLWDLTQDTLVAAHLLASNAPHNLTDLAVTWLGIDIQPYEDRLKREVLAARRRVQQARQSRKRKAPDTRTAAGRRRAAEIARDDALADWRIAEAGLPEMPSAGKEPWKADAWLLRAMARYDGLTEPDPDCEHAWCAGDEEEGGAEVSEVFCARCDGHRWHTLLAEYANADSETTVRLWGELAAEMTRRGLWPLYRERVKALPTLLGMEERGVTASRADMRKLKGELADDARRIEADLVGIALSTGCLLDLPKAGRNASLDVFLYDYLKLPPVYNHKAKTDRPCFDAKIAVPYYLDTLPEGPALRFVCGYEKRQGRLKAVDYLNTYEQMGRDLGGRPGWVVIHPHFHATGTSLLRRSCSNPNLQQVGKKKETNLRRCFGPAPGREWWSFDYKNLELRIPAYESGESDLIGLFERADDAPFYGSEHLLNFSVVYPEVWAAELPEQMKNPDHVKTKYKDTYYQWCKNGDFAVGYGAVNRADGTGTADRTFRRPGSQARLESRFAKKAAHNERQIAYARKYGYVETVPDRSLDWEGEEPKGYPLLVTRSEWGDVLPTTPLNFRTQGTAGWCTLKAMNRTAPVLKRWTVIDPRGYYLILEVHDELVFDFPAGEGPEPWRTNHGKAMEIKRLMEMSGDDIGIPLPVEPEYHPKNWATGVVVTESMIDTKEEIHAAARPTNGPRPTLVRRATALRSLDPRRGR